MKLRTYHAYSMDEALAAVKRDLGADAVILNTRTFTRRSMLGMRRKTIVEVTATPAENGLPRELRRSAQARQEEFNGGADHAVSVMAVTDDDREKTRQLAKVMAAGYDRQRTRKPVEVHTFSPDEENLHARPQRAISMDEELAAIKAMVGQVLARQNTVGGRFAPALHPALQQHHDALLAQDVSEELAHQIVNTAREELREEQLEDETSVRAAVLRHLAACIPVSDESIPLASTDGRPLTIALVGPTGVGKTTTLAKLAAMFKLHHRKRVGLITADTYRIAAVDQLRTYANIIGLPLQVVLSPAEMSQAVHRLSDCDVILIDTAGRSQNDVLRIDELRQIIEAGQPHEVHLVLSGTASPKVLLREAEAFGEVGIDKIVLTKLDEAVSFGSLIDVIRHIGKSLSFVTTGQEVPDHIEPARPERLAEMILGGALQA